MILRDPDLIVFDCDGVILNSNKVKSSAFYCSVSDYGEIASSDLYDYHIANGGISRDVKFRWFLNRYARNLSSNDYEAELSRLLANYSSMIYEQLLDCEICAGLPELRDCYNESIWVVASGGNELELRKLFKARSLDVYFDGGIFGSPDDKGTILRRELSKYRDLSSLVFLGDSRYDHEVAVVHNLDFVFISDWTEVDDWKVFCSHNSLKNVPRIADLLP
jgi:phosphoglycolate phosphatase-like HAD superfamily hydrolase